MAEAPTVLWLATFIWTITFKILKNIVCSVEAVSKLVPDHIYFHFMKHIYAFFFCHVALHWVPAQVLANTQLMQSPDVGTSAVKSKWEQHLGTEMAQVVTNPLLVCCRNNPPYWLSVPSKSTDLWQSCRLNFKAGSSEYDNLPQNTSGTYPVPASLLGFPCFLMGWMGGLHYDRGEKMSTLISSSGSVLLITCKLWLRHLVS